MVESFISKQMQYKRMKASEDGFETLLQCKVEEKQAGNFPKAFIHQSRAQTNLSYLTYISSPPLMLVALISGWCVHGGE